MSEVVIDFGRLFHDFPGDPESQHVECVMLEKWQAREVLSVLKTYRDKAPTTSYAYLDELCDALSEAL